MKDIYLAVILAIQTNLPQIKWIDLYNSQLDYLLAGENKEYPISFPALFVQFPELRYTKLDSARDVANFPITFHFAQELYADSYSQSSSQSEALSVLDNVEQLIEVLEQISGNHFDKLELVGVTPDTDYGNIVNYRIQMNTKLYRTVAVKTKTLRTVSPVTETKFKTHL